MNSKGFITPLTLIISIILLSAMLHQIKLLEQEREFINEEKEVFKLDQLLQLATVDMLALIKSQNYTVDGTINYEFGTVTYKISEETSEELNIRLKAETTDGRTNQVNIKYNQVTQQILEWTEI